MLRTTKPVSPGEAFCIHQHVCNIMSSNHLSRCTGAAAWLGTLGIDLGRTFVGAETHRKRSGNRQGLTAETAKWFTNGLSVWLFH